MFHDEDKARSMKVQHDNHIPIKQMAGIDNMVQLNPSGTKTEV